MKKVRIATRGSSLALAQSETVRDLLSSQGIESELVIVKTKGDKDRASSIQEIGGDGLFVREIEKSILAGEADIAVHSAKDLPFVLSPELIIGAVPAMADPRDLLLLRKDRDLENSNGMIIGTGSMRRISEYKRQDPHAVFKDIRGNITTRASKLRAGEYDGIIMAKAGIDRIGLDISDFDVRIFDANEMIPAPCQGILAVECKKDDREMIDVLAAITDRNAAARFDIERKLFCLLNGNCKTAVGINAAIEGETVILRALFHKKRLETTFKIDETDKKLGEIKDVLLTETEMVE